ncbi:MFS cation transporter [Williamsoniiplasma lucivorax]|uniref:MFS transporter n=1 Tax=Williamsoniiplasma lucivorax TaxID=209274 RepID=A0A2S5RDB1_9MOLU|nr:MFS cation transporter [Williamsoniiplasma lucivorax]PPE05284.1 hypothetical protein ELUCI_v1c08200 [Williamsoniiplasma lucivorax]
MHLFNWDLYIINPIFIFIGIFLLFLLAKKEKENKFWWLFYIETLAIWIVNGFLMRNNLVQMGIGTMNMSITAIAVFTIFVSAFLIGMILKPLAIWLTHKAQNRRIWMWMGIMTTLVALILATIFMNKQTPLVVLVISTLFIGFSISTQTLYFLLPNEQFYYRLFPIFTSLKMGMVTSLGAYIGLFLFSINGAISGYQEVNTHNFPNINYAVVITILFLLIGVSFAMSFFNLERTKFINSFDQTINKQLQPYRFKVLILIVLAAFWLGVMSGLIQNQLLDFMIASSLKQTNYSDSFIYSMVSFNKDAFLVPGFLFGYFIYRVIFKKMTVVQTLTILFVVSGIAAVLASFTNYLEVMVFANIIFGITISITFYLLIGYSMMWNYRNKAVLVTGFVVSANMLGIFLMETMWTILKSTYFVDSFALFSIHNILHANPATIAIFLDKINHVLTIVYAVVFTLIVFYCIFIVTWAKQFMAEMNDIQKGTLKMATIEKKIMVGKMKNKVLEFND